MERLVVDRMQALLLDPDRIARAVAAVEPRLIDKGVVAAERHANASDLLSMLPNLGVERIDLSEEQLAIVIVERRLLAVCGVDADPEREGRITLTTTVRRVRRGHELRLVIPSQNNRPAAQCDEKIMALLGEAIAARKLVIEEAPLSINQIAVKHGRCRTRLARLVRLSWLAPDIVRAIVAGKTALDLSPAQLLMINPPVGWNQQRAALNLH